MADVIELDRNGKKVLGKRGTLASLGLHVPAKKRRPKRPSPLELRQAQATEGKEVGRRGLQERVTGEPREAPPERAGRGGTNRLKRKAKKRFGVDNG